MSQVQKISFILLFWGIAWNCLAFRLLFRKEVVVDVVWILLRYAAGSEKISKNVPFTALFHLNAWLWHWSRVPKWIWRDRVLFLLGSLTSRLLRLRLGLAEIIEGLALRQTLILTRTTRIKHFLLIDLTRLRHCIFFRHKGFCMRFFLSLFRLQLPLKLHEHIHRNISIEVNNLSM